MAKNISAIFLALAASHLLVRACGDLIVPGYFIFGDSLADNGNNNPRITFAKSNYPPYGIDYPDGPTGRFTNGRNTVDAIAEFLGFARDQIQPFATSSGDAILNGVNYASGGAGIQFTIGKQLGAVISLDEQLGNHNTTVKRISGVFGNADSAKNYLGKCLYSVGIGTNDILTHFQYEQLAGPESYVDPVIEKYYGQLKTLYSYGARKIVLFGISVLGCIPQLRQRDIVGYSCNEAVNNATVYFNARVKSLVDVLNSELVDATFIFIDAFEIMNSSISAFKNPDHTCCAITGTIAGVCIPNRPACRNRSDYMFWDGIHTTEAINMIMANRSIKAQSHKDAYPFDIQHLLQLQ